MSTCTKHQEALPEYAAGDLSHERRRALEAHLEGCRECGEALAAVRSVREAVAPVPAGLEARIQAAVQTRAAGREGDGREAARGDGAGAGEGTAAVSGPAGGGSGSSEGAGAMRPRAGRTARWWRPMALPLAAAAAIAALWLGGSELARDPAGVAPVDAVEEDYDPFGAWPGAGGQVAGDPLLSELTEEQLEQLLEELES